VKKIVVLKHDDELGVINDGGRIGSDEVLGSVHSLSIVSGERD